MRAYDLVVVGSANADLVTEVERRPGAGETVLGSDLAVLPGGKGANQAVAATRLGARTALLARVGDDGHGRMLLESLEAAGVDTGAVLTGGAPTGTALITVDSSGENSIVVSRGANALLTVADVRRAAELLTTSRVVAVQLEIPLATVTEVVRIINGKARFVLNPSPATTLSREILNTCDPLIVNEHEARVLLDETHATHRNDPDDWARSLLSLGPRSVVVTLGAEGVVVAEAVGCSSHVPAPTVAAIDTTGAGDAFAAALAWRLSAGENLIHAAEFGVWAGAVTVTGRGAQASFPTVQHILALRQAVPPG